MCPLATRGEHRERERESTCYHPVGRCRLNLPSHLPRRVSPRPTSIVSYRFYPTARYLFAANRLTTRASLSSSIARYHLDNLYDGGSLRLRKGWRIASSTLQLNPISLCRRGTQGVHGILYLAVVSSSMRFAARVSNLESFSFSFLFLLTVFWSDKFDKLCIIYIRFLGKKAIVGKICVLDGTGYREIYERY